MSTKHDSTPEWQKIITSKQIQAFAGKIEMICGMEGDGRGLIKMLVEKWAELATAHRYFPDLKNVFTPEAIFQIEYAHRMADGYMCNDAYKVRCVLTGISTHLAYHNANYEHLKHLYNNTVKRHGIAKVLPLLEEAYPDGRRFECPLFILPEAKVGKVKTRRPPRKQNLAAVSDSNPWTELDGEWQRFIERIEGDTK